MAGPSTSTYAILGLLSLAPMSGYEAARFAERSISHFWPISKTHVYSELARLEELGWAEGNNVPQETLPDKRVFQITKTGEGALDEWLLAGRVPGDRFRSPFLIKLFVGHRISRDQVMEMVGGYRDDVDAERRVLQEIVQNLEGVPDAAYARASALFGLRVTEAMIAWADEVGSALPERRITIDPRRKKAKKAKELLESASPPPYRTRK